MELKQRKYLNYSLAVLLTVPIFTVFVWSDKLVNGRYTTKTFYFYLVSVIVFSIIGISLFTKKSIKIKLSKLDIAILVFYLYSIDIMIFTLNTPINCTGFLIYTLLLGIYCLFKYFIPDKNINRLLKISNILSLLFDIKNGTGKVWPIIIYNTSI